MQAGRGIFSPCKAKIRSQAFVFLGPVIQTLWDGEGAVLWRGLLCPSLSHHRSERDGAGFGDAEQFPALLGQDDEAHPHLGVVKEKALFPSPLLGEDP